MRLSKLLAWPLCLFAFLTLAIAPTVAEAKGPAVSAPNGKISIEGGEYDDEGAGLALGSYTIPLGHSFGLQLDGAVGKIDDDWMNGGGVHLFTRDPEQYLLGVYTSFHEWNDIKIFRVAAEAELYMNRFSFTGLAGYEDVDVPTISSGLQVLNRDDEHFFGHFDLAYYLTDDLKVYGGYRYLSEISLGAAGFEYLVRGVGAPISVFAKSRFGDSDHTRITGGVKIYFGADPSKSLISRHRTEDPLNFTPIFPKLRTIAGTTGLPVCSQSNEDEVLTVFPAGSCTCPDGTTAQPPGRYERVQTNVQQTNTDGSFVCAPPPVDID